ncbi:MAG: DUF6787 family protein [Bacteroidota bacterium]
MEKEKWKKIWDYSIILLVFAVTGTTAAIFPKWIMPLTGLTKGTWQYVLSYILLITPIYQVLLLIYAFIFGKFSYFYEKQKKIGRWLFGWLKPNKS